MQCQNLSCTLSTQCIVAKASYALRGAKKCLTPYIVSNSVFYSASIFGHPISSTLAEERESAT